jgi:hypothetical protein
MNNHLKIKAFMINPHLPIPLIQPQQRDEKSRESGAICNLPPEILQVILSSFDDIQALGHQAKIWEKLITPQVAFCVLSNELQGFTNILIKELKTFSQNDNKVNLIIHALTQIDERNLFSGLHFSDVKPSIDNYKNKIAEILSNLESSVLTKLLDYPHIINFAEKFHDIFIYSMVKRGDYSTAIIKSTSAKMYDLSLNLILDKLEDVLKQTSSLELLAESICNDNNSVASIEKAFGVLKHVHTSRSKYAFKALADEILKLNPNNEQIKTTVTEIISKIYQLK